MNDLKNPWQQNPWDKGGQYWPPKVLETIIDKFESNKKTTIQAKYLVGLDLSHYNSNIDWSKIGQDINYKSQNLVAISFLYIKVSEGSSYKDDLAFSHATNASKNNIPFGYYHFCRPKLGSAEIEAQNFLNAMKVLSNATLKPVLDFEVEPDGLTKDETAAWINSFAQKLGENLLIYGGGWFIESHLPASNNINRFPLWLAAHTDESKLHIPAGWTDWTIWQFAGHPTVPGNHPAITGNVDMNYAKELPTK